MRNALLLALLLTGCATAKYSPDEANFERQIKVCIYNGLSVWMNSGIFLNPAGLCDENKYTIKEDL
jgi:hypothetical protein